MKIWHVLMNSNQNDGSGHPVSTGISFKSKKDALNFVGSDYYADKFGVFGSKGSERDIEPIEVYDSPHDFNIRTFIERREELREKARSKLTKEEYDALMS